MPSVVNSRDEVIQTHTNTLTHSCFEGWVLVTWPGLSRQNVLEICAYFCDDG